MVEYSKLITTQKGQQLMAKMIQGVGNVNFTKVCSSSAEYTEEDITSLSELSSIEQTSLVSRVSIMNETTIKVETAFENRERSTGYYMRTLGLYAVDPDDGEILYAACIAKSDNCYIPAYNGMTVTGVDVNMYQTVGNSESVSLEVDPAAFVSVRQLQEVDSKVESHKGNEIYGESGVHGLRYYKNKLQAKNGEGEWDDVGKKYRTMTVKVDLSNSNPATCCTYADDAADMVAGSSEWDEFFGHYPVLFKNGSEVGRLKRDDFSKFEDGTNADISSGNAGDVMIAFPRRGLKISTNGNILTISMTDEPDNPSFSYYAHTRGNASKNVFYLGAYKGYEDSGKLRSLSGKAPTANKTIGAFRTLAQANGSGYEQSGFYQLTFRQAMYILKYANLDSQAVVGKGYTKSSHSAAINTGGSEAYGMDCEVIKKTNPSYMTDEDHHVKLFGLEDFWGNIWEWIDGIVTNSNRDILTGTDGFNDSGSGYANQGQGATSNIGNYMSKPQGTSEKGFLAKEVSGSATTYFCDYAYLSASSVASFGGTWYAASTAGAFPLSVYYAASNSGSYFAARLMFL